MNIGPTSARRAASAQCVVHKCAQLIFPIAAVALTCALAEAKSSDKHVPEIKAEMKANYPDGVSTSAICRRAEAAPTHGYLHVREINPETLKKNVLALVQASDEVVLTGGIVDSIAALSRSGEDGVGYVDVRVLHVWKGHYEPGELLTFGIPTSMVDCGFHSIVGTVTGNPQWHWPWEHHREGPFVLFLREDDSGLIDGLTLTGGDGTQGMFVVTAADIRDSHSALYACYGASYYPQTCATTGLVNPENPRCHYSAEDKRIEDENIAKCNTAVRGSPESITTGFLSPGQEISEAAAKEASHDPLKDKYDGMPISSFLKQVRDATNQPRSVGHATDTGR